MSVSSNTAAQTNGTLSPKELRQKYGVQKAPMPVKKSTHIAFAKDTNFDEQFSDPTQPNYTKVNSWVIMDSETRQVFRANTYNGNLGKNEDYRHASRLAQLPAETTSKEYKKMIKGYTPIDLDKVPFATLLVEEETNTKSEQPTDHEESAPIEKDENVEVDA